MNSHLRSMVATGVVAPLLCLCPLLAQPAPVAAQDPLQGLDRYIEEARQDWNVAGLAVGVVRNDSLVYARGFGVRDVRTGESIDEETLFAIASNSKAWTALALGLLVDEGRLSWDDPVTEHLPWFQLHDPYVTREMTVRDLLSHRSGLSRGDAVWYATPYDREEVVRRIRFLEPSWSFRSRYGYQNVMFIAAGEVLESATGTSWDRFVEARLFRPLGMDASITSTDSLPGRDNVAQPHSIIDGQLVPVPWRDFHNVGPAGSIISNIAEMAAWVRMQLAHGEFEGQRIVSDSVMEAQRTPQTITTAAPDTLEPTHFNLYGLGVGLKDYHGYKVVNHGGALDGMLSRTAFLPELDLGIVILTNTDPHNLHGALVNRIIDAHVPEVEPRDWSALYLERFRRGREQADSVRREMEDARVAGTSPSHPLSAYAGTYEHEMYGPVDIAVDQGGLVFRRHGSRGTLEHWHYDTFRADFEHPREDDIFVTFALDRMGDVVSVEVPGMGEFQRVPEVAGESG